MKLLFYDVRDLAPALRGKRSDGPLHAGVPIHPTLEQTVAAVLKKF